MKKKVLINEQNNFNRLSVPWSYDYEIGNFGELLPP